MTLEHVAIWTDRLEELKEFYVKYFNGIPGSKYINESKQIQSYFLTCKSGAILELMSMPDIPDNTNDRVIKQHKGIVHLAFGVASMTEVDQKEIELKTPGFPILSGPRKTGDGYYEFETLDPDNNRLEITCIYSDKQ